MMKIRFGKSRRYYAAIFIISLLIFSVMGPVRRSIPLSSSLLSALRALLGAVFLLAVILITKRKAFDGIKPKHLLLFALSGIAIGFNWLFLFEAYNTTTVAKATLCNYMEPVIVVLLSVPVLHQKLTVKKAVCCLTAVSGLFLASEILGTGIGATEIRGLLCGLAAGALYAAGVILTKLTDGGDSIGVTFIQLASAAAVLIPYVLLTEKIDPALFDARCILLTLFLGIFSTGVAYIFFFGGMIGLDAQSFAILSYLDPVLAIAVAAVLGEMPSLPVAVGAVIIICSLVICETDLKFAKKGRKK